MEKTREAPQGLRHIHESEETIFCGSAFQHRTAVVVLPRSRPAPRRFSAEQLQSFHRTSAPSIRSPRGVSAPWPRSTQSRASSSRGNLSCAQRASRNPSFRHPPSAMSPTRASSPQSSSAVAQPLLAQNSMSSRSRTSTGRRRMGRRSAVRTQASEKCMGRS